MNDEKQGIFKNKQTANREASAVDATVSANAMDLSELLNQYAA